MDNTIGSAVLSPEENVNLDFGHDFCNVNAGFET